MARRPRWPGLAAIGLASVISLAPTVAWTQSLPGGGASPFRTARVSETLASAQAALTRGDASMATELFERAASLEHASDIEVGLALSMMQAGHYRRALAFSAHTAGAHAGQTAGAALYAWLLGVGGQGAFAQRVLDETERRLPADALIGEVRQVLKPATSETVAVRQGLLARFAPSATAVGGGEGEGSTRRDIGGLVSSARVTGAGILVDQGRHAIAPATALEGADSAWVRTGLGHTVAAQIVRRSDSLGLVVLKLQQPLDAGPAPRLAERDAFPGAPARALAYRAAADAAPAWPWLHAGFLGPVDTLHGGRRLGIELPPGPRGGPVFDMAGQLAGIAMAAPAGADRLLPASALRTEWSDLFGSGPLPVATRLPFDDLYERGLRTTLQIIVAAASGNRPSQD